MIDDSGCSCSLSDALVASNPSSSARMTYPMGMKHAKYAAVKLNDNPQEYAADTDDAINVPRGSEFDTLMATECVQRETSIWHGI